MMFLGSHRRDVNVVGCSDPIATPWLSNQSFWNEQDRSPHELHDATRGSSQLGRRLVCRIDAHHDQIGVAGSGDADKFGARTPAGHDVAPVATWPCDISDRSVEQLSKVALQQLSSLVDVRIRASRPFPIFGKHVHGSHPRVYGARKANP